MKSSWSQAAALAPAPSPTPSAERLTPDGIAEITSGGLNPQLESVLESYMYCCVLKDLHVGRCRGKCVLCVHVFSLDLGNYYALALPTDIYATQRYRDITSETEVTSVMMCSK